jgi:hypothetical protein
MTKPSLSIVFKGQTTGELDFKQNDWQSRRENPTHILKITDERLPFEMRAPSIRYAPIGSPDRFSRRIEYRE